MSRIDVRPFWLIKWPLIARNWLGWAPEHFHFLRCLFGWLSFLLSLAGCFKNQEGRIHKITVHTGQRTHSRQIIATQSPNSFSFTAVLMRNRRNMKPPFLPHTRGLGCAEKALFLKGQKNLVRYLQRA